MIKFCPQLMAGQWVFNVHQILQNWCYCFNCWHHRVFDVALTNNFQYHRQFLDTDNIRDNSLILTISETIPWYWQYQKQFLDTDNIRDNSLILTISETIPWYWQYHSVR
jgi:hypothetical protein